MGLFDFLKNKNRKKESQDYAIIESIMTDFDKPKVEMDINTEAKNQLDNNIIESQPTRIFSKENITTSELILLKYLDNW